MDLKRSTYLLVLLIGIVFILVIGKDLLIPIVLAALIWFFVKEIRKLVQRIPFIGKRLPRWTLNLFSVIFLYVILGLIVNLMTYNINGLIGNIDLYVANLNNLNANIYAQFGINIHSLWNNSTQQMDYTSILQGFFTSLSELLSNTFMIGLYLLFILLEEATFNFKLDYFASSEQKRADLQITLTKISDSIGRYLLLKTFVSLLTALLSYIVLAIVGIHSPLFWAFLIFILNYIPTIGSLVATLFPTFMAVLQFGDIDHAVIVMVAVGAIQVLVGNIIEPKIMGNSLNVSSLVVLLALSFWGAIWGITGMVLSVPITVILIILFGQFEHTKKVAVLLSEKGNL